MLVLTRGRDEKILIGTGEDAITVTVLSVHGSVVRLGIDAKRTTPIRRTEIVEIDTDKTA